MSDDEKNRGLNELELDLAQELCRDLIATFKTSAKLNRNKDSKRNDGVATLAATVIFVATILKVMDMQTSSKESLDVFIDMLNQKFKTFSDEDAMFVLLDAR